jgi:hypothetical protein
MRHLFTLLAAAAALLLIQPHADAQQKKQQKTEKAQPKQKQMQAEEPGPVKQIQLSEKQLTAYLAAQKEMPQMPEQPNAKIEAQAEAVAKKHGFAGYDEFDDVADNISLVFDGIDPKTKAFTEPTDLLKMEIKEIQADKKMSAKEKAAALKEVNAALKTAQPLQFKGNIDLVKKYYDQIQAALQQKR